MGPAERPGAETGTIGPNYGFKGDADQAKHENFLKYYVMKKPFLTIVYKRTSQRMKEFMPANEEAVRLVFAHRPELMSYIRCIIPNPAQAEDTFSDMTVAIMNSWEHYNPERSFKSWARGVARRIAFTNLRKAALRDGPFTDDVLEDIAAEVDCVSEQSRFDLRKAALPGCMQRLRQCHQEFIQWRYYDDRSLQEISRRVGKSVGSVCVVFHRLHKLLEICINKKLRLL
jgi:RNA polymerase sigma factor (sigma-70 family)